MVNADDSTYVIAEAGVNHNGDSGRALEMIDAAADCGADAVKFQTFIPARLASRHADKADYQQRNMPGEETQLAMLEKLALPFAEHDRLLEHCRVRGIDFLSSPFDMESARFLIGKLALPKIKLGSGELSNAPLLWQVARTGTPIILSTGMADLADVRLALGVCSLGRKQVRPVDEQQCIGAFEADHPDPAITLMHCTTAYPCPPNQVNLRAMDTLREYTGLSVGYSDHTRGIEISLAAVARGASMIEKHFTLDRRLPGPDHAASLEPEELRQLVAGIRTIDQALGSADKQATVVEQANARVARKSVVAATPIRSGDTFNEDNLTLKRPGTGLAPVHYWSLLGRAADRDYETDDMIESPQ